MKKNTISDFSSVVGKIYDCTTEPAGWATLLQDMCDHFAGDTTYLGVTDPTCLETRFVAYAGKPEIAEPLATTYAHDKPFCHVLDRVPIDEPMGMKDYAVIMGPDGLADYAASDFARDWAIPHRLGDFISISLIYRKNRIGSFAVTGNIDRGPFQPHDYEYLATLAPHFRRAALVSDVFGLEDRSSGIFRAIVENLATAIIVVDSEMRLVFANPAAETLLRGGVVVSSRHDKIVFPHARAHAAIETSVKNSERDEVALGGIGIDVPLQLAASPALAHVLPLSRRPEAPQFSTSAMAAIFIAVEGTYPVPAMDAIAALFGLTPTERRVAAVAAGGQSVQDIALASGVAYSTARAHLDSIYAKTGIRDQRDLMTLIRDLTPPVN